MAETSRRGRPVTTSSEQILTVALALFAEKGFDAVTMDEIAAESGTSRRTLFRFFPRKSDLVWGGLRPVQERIAFAVAEAFQSGGSDAWPLLVDAYVRALSQSREEMAFARQRLRIIVRTPSLAGLMSVRRRDSVERLAEMVFAFEGGPGQADPLRARSIAWAISEVTGQALEWWAMADGQEDYVAVVRRALSVIAVVEPRR